MKEIEIVIDTNGEVAIEAHGFKGTGCKDATKNIEAAFGGSATSVAKPEMHMIPDDEETNMHGMSTGSM
tara:strand:+ start:177 stop:383 length:207 start_codon:yes stop_codon:yes gene_type:complete